MAQNRFLWVIAGLAVSGLVLAGCGKKTEKGADAKTPAGTETAAKPSAANDRPGDEGELKGGENVDGAPAMISEEAFLAEYKKVPGVYVRPSGIMYRIIESGPAGGKSPKVTDKIRVAYQGALMDGTVFDQNPSASFTLADTIAGWQEAVPMMKVGDAWEVVIPSALAYGDKGVQANGQQVIPPNTPLIFSIKLMEVGAK